TLKQGRQTVSNMLRLYRRKLEMIGQLSVEDAKKQLLEEVNRECQDEIRQYRRELLERSEIEVQNEAKSLLITAMQRVASSPQSEVDASTFSHSSEARKARLLAREGRNNKCFEPVSATTLLIDQYPDSFLISYVDPVRREVAKIALERLIKDGRIHP